MSGSDPKRTSQTVTFTVVENKVDFIKVIVGSATVCRSRRARSSRESYRPLGSWVRTLRPGVPILRLRELGWIEDRTIAIQYRWSEGRPARNMAKEGEAP